MYAVPYYYQQGMSSSSPPFIMFQPVVPLARRATFDNRVFDDSRTFGYSTAVQNSLPLDAQPEKLNVHMGVAELHQGLMAHLKAHPTCRISWLNRLLAKCITPADFNKAVEVYQAYQSRMIDPTAETGTLLIKAACRANIPEKALLLLQNVQRLRIFPTLGGIHYLMINFSLIKNTQSVLDTFQVAKARKIKPNTRTYHILIRECVDNNLIDEAMKFAQECSQANLILNRVAFNILMNGLRKNNRPTEMLQLRQQMNQHNLESNDTTVKFTSLAYMMLGDTQSAVQTFLSFPEIDTKYEEFCDKFLEIIQEDGVSESQKKLVTDLFSAVKSSGKKLPQATEDNLAALSSK